MTALAHRPDTLGEVDGPLECVEVHQVTHDVRSFVLDLPAPCAFEAGQYVVVTVVVDGRELSRCYSISSPPTRPDRITVTVKRVPGGPVSNWLHDHLVPGGTVHVSGPLGSFGAGRRRSAKQLYLSAGSGITPLMSMARAVVDEEAWWGPADGGADVVFVHHARTPADIVFRDELAVLDDTHPGIRVAVAVEEDAEGEVWTGHRGRMSADLLRAVAPDLAERDVFVCGPSPYRDAVRSLLLDHGVDPARIDEESYVLDGPGSREAPAPEAATFAVELRRSGRTLACPAGTMILDAAAEAGLSLPSSCGEGVCGTCKTTLLSGAVDMRHAGGIRPREIAASKVLVCCSTPTEDVVLDA